MATTNSRSSRGTNPPRERTTPKTEDRAGRNACLCRDPEAKQSAFDPKIRESSICATRTNKEGVGSSKIRDLVLPSSWIYLSKQVLQNFSSPPDRRRYSSCSSTRSKRRRWGGNSCMGHQSTLEDSRRMCRRLPDRAGKKQKHMLPTRKQGVQTIYRYSTTEVVSTHHKRERRNLWTSHHHILEPNCSSCGTNAWKKEGFARTSRQNPGILQRNSKARTGRSQDSHVCRPVPNRKRLRQDNGLGRRRVWLPTIRTCNVSWDTSNSTISLLYWSRSRKRLHRNTSLWFLPTSRTGETRWCKSTSRSPRPNSMP